MGVDRVSFKDLTCVSLLPIILIRINRGLGIGRYRDSGQNKAISRPSLAYLVNILDYSRIFEFLYQINYFFSRSHSPLYLFFRSFFTSLTRMINPACLGFYLLQCVVGTVFTTIDVFYPIYMLEDIKVSDKWFGRFIYFP